MYLFKKQTDIIIMDSENEKIDRLYEVTLKVDIQYKGEELPDDEYVIKPIVSYIKKVIRRYKHAYIITQLDVGVGEIELEDDDDFDEERA